jgi:thiamine-phosphate pyrophosphorylase
MMYVRTACASGICFSNPFTRSLHSRASLTIDPSVYLVADRKTLGCHGKPVMNDEEYFARIKLAVKGGVTCVQLRDKDRPVDTVRKAAMQLKQILDPEGIPLIIGNVGIGNVGIGNIGIALAVKAKGVYFENYSVEHKNCLYGIRSALGPLVNICIPLHNEFEAMEPEHEHADLFSVKVSSSNTTRPEDNRLLGLKGLRAVRSLTDRQLVAIGGITPDNLQSVIEELNPGDGVAMVGDLWRGDTYEIARKVRNAMKTFKGKA